MTRARPIIEVNVLGHTGVSIDEQGLRLSPVEHNLVALLVAAGPGGLDTQRLADGLWSDRLPATWSASLRNSISRLNTKVATAHPTGAKLISERTAARRLLVEPDAVDAWRLLDWAADPDAEPEPGLLPGTPFPGCELPSQLLLAIDTIASARRDLIARWEEQGAELSNQVLAAVRRLCLDEPFNQSFTYSAVRLHLASGNHDDARRLLSSIEDELRAANIPLSDQLQSIADAVDDDPTTTPVRQPPAGPVSGPIQSPDIRRLAEKPLAGRAKLVREVTDVALGRRAPGVMIHGSPGIGKSRLAAEVATQLQDAGYHTAYVVADENMFASLQPFLDSFRGLRESVRPHIDQLHLPEAHARCRVALLEYFEQAYGGHPLCLVADDLQWFDDQSRALLLSLCRADLGIELFVIAVGRPRESSAAWPSWIADLGRVGLVDQTVRALDLEAMVDMVTERLGDIVRVQASRLGERLLELSSGVPQVADWLLQRVDTETLEIQIDEVDGTGYAAVVSSLAPEVQRCGAVGSVLGIRFALDDLCELADHGPADVEQQLEALIDANLVMEQPTPGQYRFLHVLATQALGQTMPAGRHTELHARAFEQFDDPHRRAWHGFNSVPVTGKAPAAQALVASARVHFAEGNYPAATRNVQKASALDPDSVTLEDDVMSLEALERSGVRAGAQRAAVVRRAIDAGDMEAALAAASSGLPDTEAFEGDRERVAVLKRIDRDRLDPADRIELDVHLSRQLVLAGRIEEATEVAERSYREAISADEKARTWLAVQLTRGPGATDADPATMPWADQIQSADLDMRIRQAGVVNTIAAGGAKRSYQRIVEYGASATELGSVQLEWFAKMFQATALTDQGDRQAAMELAAEAQRQGLRGGLRIASGAFETQHFVWKFHEGTHGELHHFIDYDGPSDITGNIIFTAATTAVLHQYGLTEGDEAAVNRAMNRASMICQEAMSSTFDTSVVGLIADVLSAARDHELMAWATSLLEPSLGNYLLLASAAANLGPVSGVMAKVAPNRQARLGLLEQALEEADRDELALWQVVGRLDLAGELGPRDDRSGALVEQAKELAFTPWLLDVFEHRMKHIGHSG